MKLDLSRYLQTYQSPPRGPLPPGSRLPLPPNPLFTGRRQTMLAIAQYLFTPQTCTAPRTLLLYGPPAGGKTQLAVEFAYRYGRALAGVHWLDGRFSPMEEIAACGLLMGIQPWPAFLKPQVHATRAAWAAGGALLFVLDHLERPEELPSWLRLLPPDSRLLVTCHTPPAELPPDCEPLPLLPLRREDSLTLLRKLLPASRAGQAELDRLAVLVHDAPLALEMAGRFLAATPALSPADFLAQQEQNNLPTGGILPSLSALYSGHPETAEGKRTIARIHRVLGICAWCAADRPIPLERWLADTVLEEILEHFYRLGMLLQTPSGPVIYTAQALAAQQVDQAAGYPGLKELVSVLAYQIAHLNAPRDLLDLFPHLMSAARHGESQKLAEAGLLWNELGVLEKQRGELQAARRCYQTALALMEVPLGGSHPAVLRVLTNLGALFHEAGELDQARSTLQRVVSQGEPAARPFAELGAVLHAQGELLAARQALTRAVELETAAQGSHSPSLAPRLIALGRLMSDLGDHQAAREAYRRALDIDQAASGPDHTRIGQDLLLLGSAQHALGAPRTARISLDRARTVLEKNLPEAHPLRIELQIQLASVAASLGELPLAEHVLADLLERQKQYSRPAGSETTGLIQPDTAVALSTLAAVRLQMGKYPQAQQDFSQALGLDEQIFGPGHIRVAGDLTGLAKALQAGGSGRQALPLLERAALIYQVALGPAHPATLQAALLLAVAMRQNGSPSGAVDLLVRTRSLAADPAIDHALIGDICFQLGRTRLDLSQWQDAQGDLQQALAIYEKCLPQADVRRAQALHALGLALRGQGDLHAARSCCRKAIDLLAPSLPSGHPQLQSLRRTLRQIESEIKA